jgi:CHAT domain-containing protein
MWTPRSRRPDDNGPGQHFRAAFLAACEFNVSDASEIGHRWAEWAITDGGASEGDPDGIQQAAEAYWCLVQRNAEEMDRRHSVDEQRRLAAAGQGTAAAAGLWLSLAGRLEEAVIAVELARAVLLSQAVDDAPADVITRLQRAGAQELLDRYQEARQTYRTIERRAYLREAKPADSSTGSTVLVPIQEAWSRLQQVRFDVLDRIGRSDLPSISNLSQIRSSAGLSTLVYVAATPGRGYALVVRPTHEPAMVDLPELTSSALRTANADLRELTAKNGYLNRSGWDALLNWLGQAVMAPLLDALNPDSDVVLIPLGGLGLLPLHAAVIGHPPIGGSKHAGDRNALRYAPNARMLGQSRPDPLPRGAVLAVDSTLVPGLPHLPWAAVEVQQVKERYGERCVRVTDPFPEELSQLMRTADVWHLACHGVADEVDPLRSRLILSGGELFLSDIIGRSADRHRLAILSACQSAIPDQDRLDEAVGFPGALLASGVAGVIATQWVADDAAALFLTLRFHARWQSGQDPWRALAEAQQWLRNADHAALLELLSPRQAEQYLIEAGVTERLRRSWLNQRPFTHPYYWAPFTYTGS